MFGGVKRWIFGRQAEKLAEDAQMGKLGTAARVIWQFLDGWKSWIVAIVAVYKLACHACSTSGYLDAAINALGWDTVQRAFDPQEALAAALVLIALGHRLWKAVQQYRGGRTVKDLLREGHMPSATPDMPAAPAA